VTDPRPASLKGEIRIEEPDRVGRSIARRSAEVRATVPDLELEAEVDAGAAVALARRLRIELDAVLIAACARALRATPRANAAYRDGRYELYSRVNVGAIVHTDDGQITPAILDADTRSLSELDAELRRLRERARAGALTPPELAGTTFTLHSLGEAGPHRLVPLITPPQAAALAAGSVRPAPVARGGAVVAGNLISLTLACDHRILFGTRAAAFLQRIAKRVEEPEP